MAEPTTVDNGSLADYDVAVDDLGPDGVAGLAKLLVSADGDATRIPADAAHGLTVDVTRVSGTVDVSGTVALSGTSPVSAASLPLPTGAATAAKQPAPGTAGTASADVLSVQGIAGGTALPISDNGGSVTVDGTVAVSGSVAVTDNGGTLSVDDGAGSLTVDGTVTANAGTGPWPVTDNGGSLTVDGTVAATQSGTWNVGTVTSVTNVVHVDDNSGSLTIDAASLPLPTGAATAAKQPALGTAGTPSADVVSVQGVASGTVLPVSDGGGTLSIDDGGGSITVDGSLTLASPTVTRGRVASSGLTTASTSYTIGDTAGAIMTYSGAAASNGGTGELRTITLLDKGDVGTDYRLHIFRASVTLASDNAAWAVSDSDQESLIGVVTMPSLLDVGANRIATLGNVGLSYDCAATSLFVGIETRSANAVYAAATDLNLTLTFAQS